MASKFQRFLASFTLLVTIANASFLLHEAIKREKYWTSDLGRWRKLVVWISANMYEEESRLSPNHWQHQDRLACVKHIQPSQTHLELQALFYTQAKCHIKMAVLMLPLPAEDTTEENRNTCMDQLCPTYHWRTQNYSRKCGFMHQGTDGKEERGISQMGKGNWVTDICYNRNELWLNFELETDTAVVMWCPISFECWMPHIFHCW